jgi:hypothetical protein
MKHFQGAPLQARLLALHSNIRHGWKKLPGANTLAYSVPIPKFLKLCPWLNNNFLYVGASDSNPGPCDDEASVLPLRYHLWHRLYRIANIVLQIETL